MESLGVYTEDRAQFRNSGSHNRKEQAGRNSLNIKSSLHTNATLGQTGKAYSLHFFVIKGEPAHTLSPHEQ